MVNSHCCWRIKNLRCIITTCKGMMHITALINDLIFEPKYTLIFEKLQKRLIISVQFFSCCSFLLRPLKTASITVVILRVGLMNFTLGAFLKASPHHAVTQMEAILTISETIFSTWEDGFVCFSCSSCLSILP